MEYSVIILLLPLCMFLFLGLVGHKLSERVAGILGTIGLSVAAVLAYVVAFNYFTMPRNAEGVFDTLQPINFEWLRFTEHLHIDLGILLDPISVMMLVVITTVSLMVHIYSMGYMHGEKGFQRYYAFLSLFSFSMLGLVVATNIFQMYIFWELVGVSSYLLIGFYYTYPLVLYRDFRFCYIDVQSFGIGERNGRHDLYGLFGSRLGYGSYLYGRCR